MTCPRCGNETWDNRTKKMDDPKWKNAADFSCKDKACGWKSGQPASPVGVATPIAVPAVPPASPSSRDTLLIELYLDSLDRVMAKLQREKLVELFRGDAIAAMAATLFIARSKA